ncbi:MAG: PHP domain-containing protein [Oscillospiraceae bacterium]|nr:PHP domain-containing protein [Oscillospiraceae bacterium]
MNGFCDLHTHSHYSDGTLSPQELLLAAEEAHLGAVALCDHNSVSGLEEFLFYGKNSPVEAVAGTELSVEYLGKELHLLALFLKEKYFSHVADYARPMLREKEDSNLRLLENLKKVGIFLDYDEISRSTPDGMVNRAVIGGAMVEKGYVSSVKEAFHNYLDLRHGHYIPPTRPDVFDAIGFVGELDAVSVLAHPYLNLSHEELLQFLPQAKGLRAMEVYYPKFSPAERENLLSLCQMYGLLPSGGSDFHGKNKPDIALGTGRGDLFVDMEIFFGLRNIILEKDP